MVLNVFPALGTYKEVTPLPAAHNQWYVTASHGETCVTKETHVSTCWPKDNLMSQNTLFTLRLFVMSQDALKSSPVGFDAVGTSTCEHNEYSLLPSVLCA